MKVEAVKSDCIDTWNYSFLKGYIRESDAGLRSFWKIMRPVLNMDMRKPQAESQS